MHLFGDAAEQQRVGRRRVAAAHHDHRLAFVEHAVAGRAVGHAPPDELCLLGQAQRPGVGTHGQHHGAGRENALAGGQRFGAARQLHLGHLGVDRFGAEPLRLGLHGLGQREALHPIGVAGVVVYRLGEGHLAPCRQFFQYQGVQPGPHGVQCRRVARRAAAHHDHIIQTLGHCCVLLRGIPLLWSQYTPAGAETSVMRSQKAPASEDTGAAAQASAAGPGGDSQRQRDRQHGGGQYGGQNCHGGITSFPVVFFIVPRRGGALPPRGGKTPVKFG